MSRFLRVASLAVALAAIPSILCQAPAPAAAPKPGNATGQCKDGTYSVDPTKSGACRGHHGVKEWYAAAAPAAAKPAPAASAARAATPMAVAPAAAPAPAPAPARMQTPSAAPTQAAAPALKPSSGKGPKANLASTPAAAGGGPGLVWVNTSSNVYHCSGTDFYGKTKAGAYMSEADAKAKGARPDHGKACGQ